MMTKTVLPLLSGEKLTLGKCSQCGSVIDVSREPIFSISRGKQTGRCPWCDLPLQPYKVVSI